MDENCLVSKHFFKVMMPGFQEKLNLPAAFCAEVDAAEDHSSVAVVTTSKGDWKIKAHKDCEGFVSFQEGWSEFVHNHDLVLGDFLVFEHIGKMHFYAFIFDYTSSCDKQFEKDQQTEEPQGTNCNHHPDNHTKTKGIGIAYQSPYPHFTATMKPQNATKGVLYIPVEFLKSNDLYGKRSATLRVPCGKMWLVSLRIKKKYHDSVRGDIVRGWRAFYKSNKLKDGDVCLFELINSHPGTSHKTVQMDVQIFRSTR